MMDGKPKKDLTLAFIMTALNEEDNIADAVNDALRALDEFRVSGEVVVINDGSTDRTKEIVDAIMLRDHRVKMLRHDTPHGVGASFWDGVDVAGADVVCWMPGDNENDPWEILRYFSLLKHVDVVIPFVYNKHVRSLFRNGLSFVYRFIINTSFGVYFNYTNGTVLYRKSILKGLPYRSSSFFFQTDMLVRIVKKGYLFAEVPYRLGRRNTGSSKAVSFPSLMKVAKGYLRLVRDIYFTREGKIDTDFNVETTTAVRYDIKGQVSPD